MRKVGRAHLVAVGAVLFAIAGCKKDNDQYSTSGGEAAGASTGASTSVIDTTPPATPMMTDPNIVFVLDEANASDSARGKLASTKGTSADVKAFGKMMMGEHHALRVAGKQLATKLSVTPEAPVGDESQTKSQAGLADLNATAKGAAWDKAYIDYEVQAHQEVIETAGKAKDMTSNADLKKLIEDATPILQKHLDRAKEIQSKLAPVT